MKRTAAELLITVLGAALIAGGFNLFLIPHQLLSGGISGIAMIVGYVTPLNIGMLYLLFNLPVMIWGWVVLGRRFITISVVTVALTSWFMQLFPETSVTQDPLIAAIFGGVIIAIGSGITLRIGGSSGGFDIVGSILTRKSDFPLGMFLFALNGFVVLALAYVQQEWTAALRSMLCIYISGKVVDTIHIRHIKVTLFIITKNKDALLEKMLRLPRGVTLIKAEGAFSHHESDMLMTVTTRYELAELTKIIRDTDPNAFVNIVETVGVLGQFRRGNVQ
ncbi:YitT family protein [Gorillibacterium sp. sgz5001074]|uniref:YitT family protein n=1 Tax=Gorillibacterium sp. sgz5001074 TaxID=3446695 RepID=UPI003F67A0AE